jgi:hypothetical protein
VRVRTAEEAGGVAKGTFEYICDNPHLTKKTVIKTLSLAGYKPASTSSLISAMIKQRLVQMSMNGTLTTVAARYSPIKSNYHPIVKKKPVEQGIAALETQTAIAQPKYILRKAIDVDALIDTLSLREAVALHAKLSEALGR